jgi:hypothetical protein
MTPQIIDPCAEVWKDQSQICVEGQRLTPFAGHRACHCGLVDLLTIVQLESEQTVASSRTVLLELPKMYG